MSQHVSPSQKAVAKLAGVSPSTVSRALSNHPGIPPATQRRISEIAERIGYRRNALVSLLTAQLRVSRFKPTQQTLAYVTSLMHPRVTELNSTYHEFYLGAKERAEEMGFGIDLLWRREASMTASRFTQILISRGIRGLVLAPRPKAYGHISLDWNKFAVVAIGHSLPSPRVSFAGAWHYALIDKTLRMLKRYGYRKVGFWIPYDADKYANHAFSARFSLHLQSLPSSQRVPFLQDPFAKEKANRRRFERWMARHKPDALLCAGPQVPGWVRAMGLTVPDDVGIADLCLADESGEVAGMFEMPRVIAATAVDLVIEQVHHNSLGPPKNPKSVLFEGKWVDGKTLPPKGRFIGA